MHTDPVADMLVRMRNAIKEKKETADVPYSKFKEEIIKVLKAEGYVQSYEIIQRGARKFVRLQIKYGDDKTPIITKMVRISRPGCRTFVGEREIPKVLGGFGIAILSTSKGVLSNREARRQKAGGELLLKVW
jgi:small subunit ribosomal protein S8